MRKFLFTFFISICFLQGLFFGDTIYLIPYDASVLDSKVCTYSANIPYNELTTWQLLDKKVREAGHTLKCTDLSEFSNKKSLRALQNARKVIVINLPSWTGKKWHKKIFKVAREKLVLIALEPPTVVPEMYQCFHCFGKVLSWDDALCQQGKAEKINYQVWQDMQPHIPSFSEKKLLTTVCRNKRSGHPDELYSERYKVISYFEARVGNDFEFYGTGWEKLKLRTYRGPCQNKLEVLKKYRFSICYENIKNQRGYITEKIFDCFAAGCVPIYLGASNIKEYIPTNCFIAREDFTSFELLLNHIKNMKEDEYSTYLNNIRDFLKTKKAKKFGKEAFADTIMQTLH